MTKIFGGEPVAYLYGLEALLAALVAWGVGDLTQDQAGCVLTVAAAVAAVIAGWATRDTRVAAVSGLFTALATALAAWGVDFSPDQIATVAFLAAGIVGGFNRTQTEPLEVGTFRAGGAAGPRYGTVAPGGEVTT